MTSELSRYKKLDASAGYTNRQDPEAVGSAEERGPAPTWRLNVTELTTLHVVSLAGLVISSYSVP